MGAQLWECKWRWEACRRMGETMAARSTDSLCTLYHQQPPITSHIHPRSPIASHFHPRLSTSTPTSQIHCRAFHCHYHSHSHVLPLPLTSAHGFPLPLPSTLGPPIAIYIPICAPIAPQVHPWPPIAFQTKCTLAKHVTRTNQYREMYHRATGVK